MASSQWSEKPGKAIIKVSKQHWSRIAAQSNVCNLGFRVVVLTAVVMKQFLLLTKHHYTLSRDLCFYKFETKPAIKSKVKIQHTDKVVTIISNLGLLKVLSSPKQLKPLDQLIYDDLKGHMAATYWAS